MRNDEDDITEELPAALIAELRREDTSLKVLSSAVDREVLLQADNQFSNRPERRYSKPAAWLAVAASLVLAVVVTVNQDDPQPAIPAWYADHDRSGSIDIADVMLLAKSDDRPPKETLDAFANRLVALRAVGDTS